MPDLSIVTAGLPQIDDCPILTRFKAFVVPQGSVPTLEHVFRDRTVGNPLDLSAYLASQSSESLSTSVSESSPPAGVVVLRVKDALGEGLNPTKNPVWTLYGEAQDAAAGVVRVELSEDVTAHAGLYELSWAVVDDAGRPIVVDRGLLSVERSLFSSNALALYKNLGPPTLQELRMLMMDSSRNENVLLDDVEFKDDQLLLAIIEPVRYWNEQPPPIRTYTTRTFPFRGAWAAAILGRLHLMAASHYRRNVLPHSAGGTAINDKAKEKEYLEEGRRLWEEYKDWVSKKKVEINLRLFAGENVSAYSGAVYRNGW